MISLRGQVPPFQVMRVLDAVTARREAGLFVADLSAGQPSTPAPATVRAAAARALDVDRIGYTTALGIPPLPPRHRGPLPRPGGPRRRRTSDRGHDRVVRGIPARIPRRVRARRHGRHGPSGLPGVPQHARGPGVSGGRAAVRAGHPLPAHRRAVGRPARTACRPDPGQPGEPDGHDGVAGRAGRAHRVVRRARHPVDQRRDLSRHHLRRAAVVGVAALSHAGRRQLLLQILLDDRLAHRVAARARRAHGFRRPADRQLHDLPAGAVAAGRGRRVRRLRRAGRERRARYAANRAMLLDALPAIGLDRLAPADGAFYVYADVSRWTDDSISFAARLLADTGVAIVPGVDFDTVDGGRYVRMCFAGDGAEIARAVEIMGDWLA